MFQKFKIVHWKISVNQTRRFGPGVRDSRTQHASAIFEVQSRFAKVRRAIPCFTRSSRRCQSRPARRRRRLEQPRRCRTQGRRPTHSTVKIKSLRIGNARSLRNTELQFNLIDWTFTVPVLTLSNVKSVKLCVKTSRPK